MEPQQVVNAAAFGQAHSSPDLSNRYQFLGGTSGKWSVTRQHAVRGDGLPVVQKIDILSGASAQQPADTKWALQGFTSNVRYANANEVASLKASQPVLNRPEATSAALIPIRKSPAWWNLAQDERRAIFEGTSHHTGNHLISSPGLNSRRNISRSSTTCYPGFARQRSGITLNAKWRFAWTALNRALKQFNALERRFLKFNIVPTKMLTLHFGHDRESLVPAF